MKQVIRNNMIHWEQGEPGNIPRANLILLHVCRVRNNLFHGGKFYDHWFPPIRDINLLKHSLTILCACLAVSEPVRDAYRD
jgi:hypothetical protein